MMDIEFENQLRSIAAEMEYPPTPDIAGRFTARIKSTFRPRLFPRKLAWSLTVMLVLLSSLLLIPPARAAIIEFIQIGIVRLFPQPVEDVAPDIQKPSTATPNAELPSLIPLLNKISGETTLAGAQRTASYPLLLPTHPEGIGVPDHVYVQESEGEITVLAWMDSQQPGRVEMSLHFIPAGHWAINKMGPTVIEETEVKGHRALWTQGSYPLIMSNGTIDFIRLIEGHVLIWTNGDITYRLETDLSVEEAVMVAESLEPIR